MRKALIAAALVAAMAATASPTPSHARDGGAVAAGIIGGLAVGGLLGAAAAQPRYYYGPAPVYVEGAPPRCYWTRGQAVWDPYLGAWRHPRVRVCD